MIQFLKKKKEKDDYTFHWYSPGMTDYLNGGKDNV